MRRKSNFEAPLASNPANGINNSPLGGEDSSVKKGDLKEVLDEVKTSNYDLQEMSSKVSETADNVQDSRTKKNLYSLSDAVLMSKDPKKRTKDPDTDKYDPTAAEIAGKIEKEVLSKDVAVYNFRTAQVKKKKKTRGNPFRVLMGKVGKLLDHGIEKNDITRYLAKLKYWNKETIERAVDIVKDYNKKKKQDSDKTAETIDTEKFTKDVQTLKDVQKTLKDIDTSYSKKKEVTSGINYDKKPDFTKRSTSELIMRTCFLMDLMDYDKKTPQGDFKEAANKTGAKEELKQIKSALIERGFDKEELSMLGLGN
jgi:hypothetical protein